MCPPAGPGERRGWPIRQGRTVAGPVRPDHAGGGQTSASVPWGGPPSPRHRWPPPTGLPTPLCQLSPASRVRGRTSRRSRPPPRWCLRPALEVEAPRVPVQAFGPRCWDDVPPRHHRASGTPETGSRVGFAYSPGLPRWHTRLYLCALWVSPYYAGFVALRLPPSKPGPPPVRRFAPSGSPVSVSLPECPRL